MLHQPMAPTMVNRITFLVCPRLPALPPPLSRSSRAPMSERPQVSMSWGVSHMHLSISPFSNHRPILSTSTHTLSWSSCPILSFGTSSYQGIICGSFVLGNQKLFFPPRGIISGAFSLSLSNLISHPNTHHATNLYFIYLPFCLNSLAILTPTTTTPTQT